LIIGKISKIVAIRCQILRLKCTKFDFFLVGAPFQSPPALGELRAFLQTPLAGFRWPTSKGRERVEEEKGQGRKREGRRGKRGEVKVKEGSP